MSSRLPRWTVPLVLSMLVVGLVLMHGHDVHPASSHPAGIHASMSVAEAHPQVHPHQESPTGTHPHCVMCLVGHVIAACAAIIFTLASIGLLHLLLTRPNLLASATGLARRHLGCAHLTYPTAPAWVRLSVMRC